MFDWAVATVPTVGEAKPGWGRWLRARRSLAPNAEGELETAYYMCGAPIGTSDDEFIQVAGRPRRWDRRPESTDTRLALGTRDSRYFDQQSLHPCHEEVARARVGYALLVYVLLRHFCRRRTTNSAER